MVLISYEILFVSKYKHIKKVTDTRYLLNIPTIQFHKILNNTEIYYIDIFRKKNRK